MIFNKNQDQGQLERYRPSLIRFSSFFIYFYGNCHVSNFAIPQFETALLFQQIIGKPFKRHIKYRFPLHRFLRFAKIHFADTPTFSWLIEHFGFPFLKLQDRTISNSNIMYQNSNHNDCKKNLRRTPSNSMKVYSTILQGHEATKENAKEWAQGFDFSQDETEEFGYKFCHYIDTVNGIDIHYNYGADYYFFSDNIEPVSTN